MSSKQRQFSEHLDALLGWQEIESLVNEYDLQSESQNFNVLTLVRAVLLQHCYNLSDEQHCALLKDRLSWRHFIGLGPEEETPDEKTLKDFREALSRTGLPLRLLLLCRQQLDRQDHDLQYGSLREARLIEFRRSNKDNGGSGSGIPKIIHQSYKTSDHPYPKEWQRTWIEHHPDWSYRFHTDLDNRHLVTSRFPQFLQAFDAFPQGIMRADFSRFLYLFEWGGVYADLDYVCLAPLDPLVRRIAHMGIPELPRNRHYQYHNALMISEARNPFWLKCAEGAVEYFRSSAPPGVEWLAGPFRVQATIESEKPDFMALPQEDVTPLDWFSYSDIGDADVAAAALRHLLLSASPAVMRSAFPRSFALTLWHHLWS